MVDCRSGKPFDLVAQPEGDAIMRLPPFDAPLRLLTIQPVGGGGKGQASRRAGEAAFIAGRAARNQPDAGHEHVPRPGRHDAADEGRIDDGHGGPARPRRTRGRRPRYPG